jgi:hypothetical protein
MLTLQKSSWIYAGARSSKGTSLKINITDRMALRRTMKEPRE